MTTLHTYVAPINVSSAFTAQIDIFELVCGSSSALVLMGFEIGQTTEVGDAQEEILSVVLKRVTGAPTSGSGGGTSTPQPTNSGGAAFGGTLETGNTTKLTGGTSVDVARFAWNVRMPLLWRPIPEEWIGLAVSTRLVLELATTPADSIGGILGWLSLGEMQ
jgi:hypothetical protein